MKQKLLPKKEIIKRLTALFGGRTTEWRGARRITVATIARYLGVQRNRIYDYALQRWPITDDMQVKLSRILIDIENQTLVLGIVEGKGVLVRADKAPDETPKECASVDWTEGSPKIQWGGGKLWRS
jgi:hypothetical protein